MRVERARENVFTVTATSQELSALVAAARMALEAMRAAPEPPPVEALEDGRPPGRRLTRPLVAGPAAVESVQAGAPAAVCSRAWAVI
jgi:hypothetical protein